MLQKSVLRVILAFSLVLFIPETFAHVKWFVPTDGVVDSAFIPYAIDDLAVLLWIGIAILIIISSVLLDSRLPSPPIVETRIRKEIIAILRVCTGMSLLLTAYDGSIFAPHYQAGGNFGVILLIIEGIAGVLLISNYFVLQASLMLFTLYAALILQFGFIETMEYWNIIGIAFFLMFNNLSNSHYEEKLKPYSVPVLRIFTGIALVTLGLSEKLLGAEHGEAFIAEFEWNFMFNLGFENFSDRLFVLSTGMMEVVFGIILILGTTTRLNVLVISAFMLTSNITFLVQGDNTAALMELIGHLPIIATAVICIFFGYGQRLKVTRLFNTQDREHG
jgi:uncharacterized membrane protein YphA (DoxX/SURF4 family)